MQSPKFASVGPFFLLCDECLAEDFLEFRFISELFNLHQLLLSCSMLLGLNLSSSCAFGSGDARATGPRGTLLVAGHLLTERTRTSWHRSIVLQWRN